MTTTTVAFIPLHVASCDQIVRVLYLDYEGRSLPPGHEHGAVAALVTCVHGHSATVRREPAIVTRPEITPDEQAFADDWNAGVPSRELSERYLLSRPQVEALRVRLNDLGLALQDRRGSRVGRPVTPSPRAMVAHGMAMNAAFKRGQM